MTRYPTKAGGGGSWVGAGCQGGSGEFSIREPQGMSQSHLRCPAPPNRCENSDEGMECDGF